MLKDLKEWGHKKWEESVCKLSVVTKNVTEQMEKGKITEAITGKLD